MRHTITALLLGLTLATPLFAGTAADAISVADPWAKETPPGLKVSAGFLVLKNSDDKEHQLVAAESSVSGMVELHTHINDQGVMRMRPVENIPVPAGGTAKLQPGGLHLMIMMLKQPLKAGEKIDITLLFEDGSKKAIEAEVRSFAMQPMHGKPMKMGH